MQLDQSSISTPSSFAHKVEKFFWVFYILFPFLTGDWQAYDWLPHESYEFGTHTLLASHEVCDETRCGDKADSWQDKETGEIYTRKDFADHQHSEAFRMALTWFAYGVVGCFGFAFFRDLSKPETFFKYLRSAFFVNVAVAAYIFISIWS